MEQLPEGEVLGRAGGSTGSGGGDGDGDVPCPKPGTQLLGKERELCVCVRERECRRVTDPRQQEQGFEGRTCTSFPHCLQKNMSWSPRDEW